MDSSVSDTKLHNVELAPDSMRVQDGDQESELLVS